MPIARVQLNNINPSLFSAAKRAKSAKKIQVIAQNNSLEIREVTNPAQKKSANFSTVKASDDTSGTHCDYVYSLMISGMLC